MTFCPPQQAAGARALRGRGRAALGRARGAGRAVLQDRRWWPAVLYPAGLLAAGALLAAVPDPVADRMVDWASTDLDNLGRNPVGSMLASAFVVQGGLLAWVGLGALGLGTLGRRFGAGRTLALAGAAHVVGTLASQAVTGWRLHAGLAEQAERYALDVGPSYVVVGALAAGLVAGTRWTRPLCALGLGVLSPFLFEGLGDLEVAAVGHLVAIGTGLSGSTMAMLVDRVRARR